jgi:hypothetical protein
LGKVLAIAQETLGQSIDLLGMDACLMSNLEVAYQARPYVHYVVASEENEPFDGWPYTEVLQRLVDEPEMATAQWAAHIVDAYIASYAGTGNTVTQAVLDLSRVEELAGAMDDLAEALLDHMPASRPEMWMASMQPAATFFHNTLWDIAHVCERLQAGTASRAVKRAAQRVREALVPGGFVVAEKHRGSKVQRCRGVTVYLLAPPGQLSRFYGDLDLSHNHRWHALMQAYHATP